MELLTSFHKYMRREEGGGGLGDRRSSFFPQGKREGKKVGLGFLLFPHVIEELRLSESCSSDPRRKGRGKSGRRYLAFSRT
jgi:hypothetical protein